MKSFRFIALTVLLMSLLAVPFVAYAQDAVAVRNQLISQRCQQLDTAIGQLQRRDLVSRTNVGREYETISKELDAFDQRVHNNDLDSKPFEQLLAQFDDAANQFRDAYVHYDDGLNKLQAINCQAKPADFDTQLQQTRSLRGAVQSAIEHTGAVLGQYHDLAAQLQTADQLPQGSTQ